MMNGAFEIPEDSFSSSPVSCSGRVHKLAQLVDIEGNVELSKSAILKRKIWRYSMASEREREIPSRRESFELEVVGMEHDLAPTMCARCRSSVKYLN